MGIRTIASRGAFILAAVTWLGMAADAYADKASDTLNWATRYPIEVIDPYMNKTAREALVINGELVWDTLIWRDPASGEYKPLLAKEWKWVDDTTLEFVLRDDVKWHNGAPLTADDAVYTFTRISEPGTKVQGVHVAWIKGAKKVDSHTFHLLLKAPFPLAFEYLASLLPVMPDKLYREDGTLPPPNEIYGTGPYRIVDFQPGASITVELSGTYFADSPKGQPTIKRISYRNMPENSTQIAELLSGGIDWMWNLPADQAAPLQQSPDIVVTPVETMRLSFLTFNMRDRSSGKNPLQDKRVRQAIAHAIDRERIIQAMVGEGSEVPLAACFKTQFGCVQDVVQYPYDPERAKALLAEAGYASGLTLELQAFRSRDWTAAVAGFLEAVGIKTEINYLPFAAAQERMAKNEMQMYLQDQGWLSVNDVQAVLNLYFNGNDFDSAQDAELTGWVKAAATSTDPDKRKELLAKSLHRIADEAYWVSMWTHPNIYAFTSELDIPLFSDENPRFYFAKWK